MIYIEMPLWLAIVIAIGFIVILIHFIIGDFIAKLLIRYFKEKEKKDE